MKLQTLAPRLVQPNFFYGSLLAVFGIEIVADWLGRSWAKVSRAEYILLWVTFLAICQGAEAFTRSACEAFPDHGNRHRDIAADSLCPFDCPQDLMTGLDILSATNEVQRRPGC